MREFVYLDEVSVTSLLSSRLGKLPTEFTDGLTQAKKAELLSQVEATPPLFKARLRGKYESGWTEDSKVVSKATIQATFKRLYESECDRFVLGPPVEDGRTSSPDSPAKIALSDVSRWPGPPGVVSNGELKRGSLVEVEVELQADPIFRVSTFMSTFTEIAKESKSILATIKEQEFELAIEFNRVLEKLMSGLVPLKCKLLHYAVLDVGGREFLVQRSLLPDPGDLSAVNAHVRDAFLVGLAENMHFWKDVRRVLFSGSRFRVLCRLNNDGIGTSWTPVKLVDVFGDIAPQMRVVMDNLGPATLRAMIESTSNASAIDERRVTALRYFSDALADESGVVLSEAESAELAEIALENAGKLTSLAESRRTFEPIVAFIAKRSGRSLDSVSVSRLRVEACRIFDLAPTARQSGAGRKSRLGNADSTEADERFLDSEIVAIYW